ncbi:MAG: hypothetical protein ACRDQA_07525 [Nocardioidaceae bacterium]
MSNHRRFVLVRHEDTTGVSGTGTVAEGVEFSGGVVALQWISSWPTSVVFHQRGMESVQAVHGHGGSTTIEWLDPAREPHTAYRSASTGRYTTAEENTENPAETVKERQ